MAGPSGTVTFLFTDIEGSTRLWESAPDAMRAALARHDEILRAEIPAHGGYIFSTGGDGFAAAFSRAGDGVMAAATSQRRLAAEVWPGGAAIAVRMGLHTGEAEERDGDYFGPAVNRAARLMTVAHGGQVVCSAATADLLDDVSTLVDLGEVRLRDLDRPVRVFQVGAGIFAPLRSLETYLGNLPVQLTSFVGREDDVREVAKSLDHARLVTLTGVGGVGKTRLALQVAAELLPQFPDGAWLCELAAASDADTLVQVVAATVGVARRQDLSLAANIVEFLRRARMLLVLDNCEHLLEPAGQLAAAVLTGCPGVRVLATSREGLAVPGEQVWPLRSLGVPSAAAATATALTADAVRLFCDRAVSARPGFVLSDSNAASVVEVCRRLDGMPLAIELAAARVSAMAPAEIAALLDERFRLLTGGRRTAVERHQTLRATVDWSYALLSGTERLVFDRLAVFSGSFDATSAVAVANGEGVERWDVLDALAGLVAKSMIVPEEGPGGSTRYQLLETLRQYAQERLDGRGETDAWRRVHALHFARVAEEIGAGLLGRDDVVWRQRLAADLDNLRSAVSWGLDSAEPRDQQVAVAAVAALAYETQDRPSGIGTWAERAVGAARSAPAGHRDAVLAAASWAAQIRGDMQASVSYAEEALAAGYPPDSPAPGVAALQAVTAYTYLGRRGEAQDALLHAFDTLDRPTTHPYHRANLRMARVATGMLIDDPAAEIEEARTALRLAEEAGSLSMLSYTSYAVGWALRYEDPDGAIAAYDRCTALSRQLRSGFLLPLALSFGAAIKAKQGLASEALADMLAGLEKSALDADWPFIAGGLDSAVDMFSALGEWRTAAVLAAALETPSLLPIRYPPVSQLGPGLKARTEVLGRVRSELGEEVYEQAAHLGRSMGREDVLAFALDRVRSRLEAMPA